MQRINKKLRENKRRGIQTSLNHRKLKNQSGLFLVSQVMSALAIQVMIFVALPTMFRSEQPLNVIAFIAEKTVGTSVLIVAIILYIYIRRKLSPALRPVTEIISYRKESYKEYLKKLNECCCKLKLAGCESDVDIYCPDLERLKVLAEKI